MLGLLGLMLAAAAPVIGAAPPARTLQQDFDTASTHAAAGNCAAAIPLFEALERNPKYKPGSLSAAAISVRKGQCLVATGRSDEGEPGIEAGLPTLEAAGAAFSGDVAESFSRLGDAALARWDYAGATSRYQRALTLLQGAARIAVLGKLAKATAFDGGGQSLAYSSEAITLVSADPKPNKDVLAALHTLHARTLLNQGQAPAAYAELKQALALSGGLTSRTSLSEVVLRGDLAVAAMQVGKKDDARLYLAYTGAGRLEKTPFSRAVGMDPPLCGEATGLQPNDVAVVDFSIADDGTVPSAQTVYSRGGPAVAAAFGRAVSQWYWEPERIAEIPAFYRASTRVEVRCSNVMGNGPSLFSPLDSRFAQWAATVMPPTVRFSGNPVEQTAALRAFATAGGDAAAQFAALAWLVAYEPASARASTATADQALALTAKAAIPAEALTWLRIARLRAAARTRNVNRADRAALLALAADPTIAADALAVDTLRVAAAGALRRTDDAATSVQLLTAAAQDERLPERHPLRQLAWLRLADVAAAAGDRGKAHDYFLKTGLTEQQCAMLSVAPARQRTGASGADYPIEALMMGFEGWVRLEFDINADGRTANARPIVAYPPLIFVEAAQGMANGVRYAPSYRPGEGVACSANRETINFVIPNKH